MSESERRIADAQGRFLQVVKDGREIDDARWTPGRLLLSNRRLILAAEEGKRTISLSGVDSIGGRKDQNQAIARISRYTSLRVGDDVLLVAAQDHESFEVDLYTALLHDEVFLVRHPAVEGGVVQETGWEQARMKLDADRTINVATTEGSFVAIELHEIGNVGVGERTVRDRPRRVVEVEHSDEGTSVETHIAGSARASTVLKSLLERGLARTSGEIDLDPAEKQVLMALYSGVSPFEIPEFTGVDVDDVEETFERLIELDVLDEVRKRREVALTPRGRNLASEAISDE